MLFGRKLHDYYQANKKLISIENRLGEIEQGQSKLIYQQEQQLELINKLKQMPINEDQMIELALAEQRLILLRKESERSEPKWMEESFNLMQMHQELKQKIEAAKQYVPNAIWEEYYKVEELIDTPVVEVKRQMCTGCFIPLSQSNFNKWRIGKELVKCDICGRILA